MGSALSGGAYDINRLAYMGGGYEYRKYSLGSMTVLGINRLGASQNTIYIKDWQGGRNTNLKAICGDSMPTKCFKGMKSNKNHS